MEKANENDDDAQDIGQIQFSISSHEEIVRYSVCKLTESKLEGEGTVYDPSMGPYKSGNCMTCGNNNIDCIGHFGHIEFGVMLFHPLMLKKILDVLRCVCQECSTFRLTEIRYKKFGFHKSKGPQRDKNVLEACEKVSLCHNPECESVLANYVIINEKIYTYYADKKQKVIVQPGSVFEIFRSITRDDVTRIGMDSEFAHPMNMILRSLPVLPPCARPPVLNGGKINHDDLTLKYSEIIKWNNRLDEFRADPGKYEDAKARLEFHVATLMDNHKGLAKSGNNRPIKAIDGRLGGKQGLIRQNLCGKRVNQSARSVIDAEPYALLNELYCSRQIADDLGYQIRVCDYNRSYVDKMIKNGEVKSIIKYRDGQPRYYNADIVLKLPKFKIEIGDVVERSLRDGDDVLLNRQPSLHKYSMMGFKLRIRDKLQINKKKNYDTASFEVNEHKYVAQFEPDTVLRYRNGEIHDYKSTEPKYELCKAGCGLQIIESGYKDVEYIEKNEDGKFVKVIKNEFFPRLPRDPLPSELYNDFGTNDENEVVFLITQKGECISAPREESTDIKPFRFNVSATTPFNADFDGEIMPSTGEMKSLLSPSLFLY